jgi:hypothetical protein
MKSVSREGTYYRVYKPDWGDPLDTSFAKERGGRWSPPREFGVLYLNHSVDVAAANARASHAGRAIGLFDLKPDRRPGLLQVCVSRSSVLDVVTAVGISALRLPKTYPFSIARARCWPIARRAYADVKLSGIACRSAAECTKTTWIGEELAWFDRAPHLTENGPRRDFADWYPDPQP